MNRAMQNNQHQRTSRHYETLLTGFTKKWIGGMLGLVTIQQMHKTIWFITCGQLSWLTMYILSFTITNNGRTPLIDWLECD